LAPVYQGNALLQAFVPFAAAAVGAGGAGYDVAIIRSITASASRASKTILRAAVTQAEVRVNKDAQLHRRADQPGRRRIGDRAPNLAASLRGFP